jgi:adenylate cyclase
MQSAFRQKLNEELLKSERRRTIILMTIFLFAALLRYFTFYVLKIDEGTALTQSFVTVWLFPVSILLFELLSFYHIDRRIRSGKTEVPRAAQYLNTAFEIGLPTLLIVLVADQYPGYNVVESPAMMIYFLFIVMSTLRLQPWLSVICGLLSALVNLFFCLYLYHQFSSDDLARTIIFLFCGAAAGLVAQQIRKSINNSLQEAEKRHRVENLLGRQVSSEVAEKMLANDGKIESKRMDVSVMFVDIRNFTRFAAGRNPEEIVQYQNAFFKVVINTVSKYHGMVHQFLGDGCMITFGAPLVLENPSQHAVNASIELLQLINDAGIKGDLVPTKIGIGIHTGEAVTGNIGTAERQQYSVTGSVVILAARIEQLNKEFGSQILVSEDVIESIGDRAYSAVHYGLVALKGWHKPVSVFKLA